jgi:hypothetical protein
LDEKALKPTAEIQAAALPPGPGLKVMLFQVLSVGKFRHVKGTG